MKNKNVLLLTLSALIFAQSLSASRLNMGDDESRFTNNRGFSHTHALTSTPSEDSYWSWGTSFFQRNKATIAAGLVIGASIACATYSYFYGTTDENEGYSTPTPSGFVHTYSNHDFHNLTVEASVLDQVSGAFVNGVCQLVKSYTTDGYVSFESDCSDFYSQNPSFFGNK
jgi:hypothetical protein